MYTDNGKISVTGFLVRKWERDLENNRLGDIKAVAFDIDGTLYKQKYLYIRMPFHFLRYNQFFLKYGLVRRKLRKDNISSEVGKVQTQYMSRMLKVSVEKADELLKKIVYEGLKRYFRHIKPCKDAVETIRMLKEAGYKIALLSDFPPEQKGELWGLKPLCDVVLGTEACGALKPSPVPFNKLAEDLGVEPKQILYVGNSYKYDVCGSRGTGMKAAWFVSEWNKRFHSKEKTADLIFSQYGELREFVLGK